MDKTLHTKASEIIAKVIDLKESKARKIIKAECGENQELKKLVEDLYANILEDEAPKKEEIQSSNNTRGFSKSRIGARQDTTRIFGSITEFLFANKINRFITLVLFVVIVVGIAAAIRASFRIEIKELVQEQQVALLNTQYNNLNQWMHERHAEVQKLAKKPEIIEITNFVDSLSLEFDDFTALKEEESFKNLAIRLNKYRIEKGLPTLSIVHKNDPMFLILTEISPDSTDNTFTGLQLGRIFYEYYQRIKDEGSLIIPPIHDTERFREVPEGLNVGMYISFGSVVEKDGKIVGILLLEFNVENEFSDILQAGYFGKTAETYAVDVFGRMISESRFTKEIQNTYLLDYDTTKSSVQMWVRNPGNNVFENKAPAKERLSQELTEIVALYSGENFGEEKRITEGSIMDPYNDYRGIKVVGSFKWFPEYNFGLISEVDAKEAFIALHYADFTFAAFIIIMLVLAILLYNSNLKMARFGKKIKDFQLLGQYMLKEKLGEGGFGQVYKAEHSFLKNPVAIKLLKKEFIGTDMLDRFEKEVKVTASLSNPNTIRVFDYGTSESGQFYYVMEYLNGVSLDKIVEQSEIVPVGRTVHILLNCCYSLQEAHQKGLVHRDVKPMNIMICNQGGLYDTIKILDFGLVKNMDAGISQQTQLNRIGGTPMFMAPERLRDPFNTDHRVDIYALGAVGLYMLSGQFLLELISKRMMSGQETLTGEFKSQLIERNDVPEKLKLLLESCVSFSVEKRPENIEEMILVLEQLKLEYPWNREDAKKWWKKYDVYS